MSRKYRITEEQIRSFEKPRPTLAEMMEAVNRNPQPVSPWVVAMRMLAMLLLSMAVWAVVLVALPFALTVVGALLPIAAITLLVRHVVRLQRRRQH